jgi:hypothetical protein
VKDGQKITILRVSHPKEVERLPQELIEYKWKAKLAQNNAMTEFPKDGMHNLDDGKVVNIAIFDSKEDSPEMNFSSADKLIPEEI